MLGLSELCSVEVLLLFILFFIVFFFLSESSGSLGNGRSTAIELSVRSVPRLEVNRTGGAGGFSSSDDIFTTYKQKSLVLQLGQA